MNSSINSINEMHDYEYVGVKHLPNPTTIPFPVAISPFPFGQNLDDQLMETSFQESYARDHAQFIWRASIKFLRRSLQIEIDEQRGFNDEQIFQPLLQQKRSLQYRKQTAEVIEQIAFMNEDEKQKMKMVLNFCRNLSRLLDSLSKLFDQQIIKELIFVLRYVWQKYEAFKLSKKYSSELSLVLFPAYQSLNLQRIEKDQVKKIEYYEAATQKQILEMADEAGTEIASNLFIDNKLRYINLKEAQAVSKDSNNVRKQFQLFIQAIAKTAFLCIEGYFCQLDEQSPQQERVDKQKSFFDQFQQNMNQGKKKKNI